MQTTEFSQALFGITEMSCFVLSFFTMQKTLRYNIIFRPEPEGGFTVLVPSLPGCITYGKDLGEARKMAQDAICGYLVSLQKHKEPIPQTDAEFLMSSIELPALDKTLAYA